MTNQGYYIPAERIRIIMRALREAAKKGDRETILLLIQQAEEDIFREEVFRQ